MRSSGREGYTSRIACVAILIAIYESKRKNYQMSSDNCEIYPFTKIFFRKYLQVLKADFQKEFLNRDVVDKNGY